jgi:hypothetical protein
VETRDAAIVDAMTKAWDRVRQQDGRVPPIGFYLTSGRGTWCSTCSFGEPEPVVRVNLMKDGRNLTGHEVLLNLLHLGAHAISGMDTNGVWHPQTSQEGRYHNEAFADAAASLGLDAEKQRKGGTGWSEVSLSVDADRRYRTEIRALDKAMSDWEPEGVARRQTRGAIDMECSCTAATLPGAKKYPRVIRAGSLIALGPKIVCEACGQPFRIVPGQRVSEGDRAKPQLATRSRPEAAPRRRRSVAAEIARFKEKEKQGTPAGSVPLSNAVKAVRNDRSRDD